MTIYFVYIIYLINYCIFFKNNVPIISALKLKMYYEDINIPYIINAKFMKGVIQII